MSTITSTPPPLNPLDHAALRRVLAHHIADCTANLPRLSEALFGLEIIGPWAQTCPSLGRFLIPRLLIGSWSGVSL